MKITIKKFSQLKLIYQKLSNIKITSGPPKKILRTSLEPPNINVIFGHSFPRSAK